MEVLVVLASLVLVWMAWQLYRAKQFNRFKKLIELEIKPKVINEIKEELLATRSELFPNNDSHVDASIYYWCQYKSRILQKALASEVITEQWLRDTGNYRNCQHLFHIERQYMH